MGVARNERRKARFVEAYRSLCEEWGAMVIMHERDGYTAFAVTRAVPEDIRRACDEMLIEDTADYRSVR